MLIFSRALLGIGGATIAVFDLHTVFLLVPVALTIILLAATWWAWRR